MRNHAPQTDRLPQRDYLLHLYNARDVLAQLRCVEPLQDWIEKYETGRQFAVDSQLSIACREMSEIGFWIDNAMRRGLSASLAERIEHFGDIARSIVDPDGNFNSKEKHLEKRRYNPNSGAQLARWLYEIKQLPMFFDGKGGELLAEEVDSGEKNPSVSAAALLALQAHGVSAEVDAVIEATIKLKSHKVLKSNFVDSLETYHPTDFDDAGWRCERIPQPWRPVVDLDRFHPNWQCHIVPTGRLSSSPNVQNWPALGIVNMRRMVVAPPGHVIVGLDLEQVELRIFADDARAERLIEAFKSGKDPHTMNAAILLSKKVDDIPLWYEKLCAAKKSTDPAIKSKFDFIRRCAKEFIFLEINGGEAKRLGEVMRSKRDKATGQRTFDPKDLPDSRVLGWHKNVRQAYPELERWLKSVAARCDEEGFVQETFHGRKRFFLRGSKKKAAPSNLRIQGRASGYANELLLRVAAEIGFRRWSAYSGPFSLVHDELLTVVPEHRAEEAVEIIQRCSQFHDRQIPIFGKAKAAKCWAEAKA